jgi:hypothetical protein
MIAANTLSSPDSNLLSWKVPPMSGQKPYKIPDLSGKTPDKSSDSVTKQIHPDFSQAICDSVGPTTADSSTTVVPSPVEVKSLPLEWVLGRHEREHEQTSADRAIEDLARQEMREIDPWLRDDLRQAQITLILAQRGNTEPFVVASYTMYGVHPDKVWSSIQAMRHAKLGAEYSSFYDAAGNDRPDIPKKSVASSGQVSPEGARRPSRTVDMPVAGIVGPDSATALQERGISPDSSSAEGFTYNRKAAEKSGISEPAGIHSAHKRVEYSADSVPSPVTSAEGKYVSPSAEPKKDAA